MSPYNDKRIKSETTRRLNNKFNIGENQFHLKTINGKLISSSYDEDESEAIETRGGGGDERMRILSFPSGSKGTINTIKIVRSIINFISLYLIYLFIYFHTNSHQKFGISNELVKWTWRNTI